MIKYIKYLIHLLKHKYYVTIICFKLGIYKQGIIHDWSRFLPQEFIPLSRFMFSGKEKRYFHQNNNKLNSILITDYGVDRCSWWHSKLNRHHWTWWIIYGDDARPVIMEMDRRFAKEMLADWYSASIVKTGKVDLVNWYNQRKDIILLAPKTRRYVEKLLPIVEKL